MDEVKRAKGNPGKRSLKPTNKNDKAAPSPAHNHVPVPEYLTKPEERALFTNVINNVLHGSIARVSDAHAYARWAVYAFKWGQNKLLLDVEDADIVYETQSKHGSMLRIHPRFVAIDRLEKLLTALEDRLGLNPVARQNILRGMMALPAPIQESFFEQLAWTNKQTPPDGAAPESPLGYVATQH